MNSQEYYQWRQDAKDALMKLYSEEEAGIVLNWFDMIKGAKEHELLGQEKFEAMVAFTGIGIEQKVWKLYNTMMARLFMYAPLILKERNA